MQVIKTHQRQSFHVHVILPSSMLPRKTSHEALQNNLAEVLLFIYAPSFFSMNADMNKWYKCVRLSFCLCGCPLRVAQTKQTAVFMKQRRATRVFCLLVHFRSRRHVLMCTQKHCTCPLMPLLLIPSSFTCCTLSHFWPAVFSSLPIALSLSVSCSLPSSLFFSG